MCYNKCDMGGYSCAQQKKDRTGFGVRWRYLWQGSGEIQLAADFRVSHKVERLEHCRGESAVKPSCLGIVGTMSVC